MYDEMYIPELKSSKEAAEHREPERDSRSWPVGAATAEHRLAFAFATASQQRLVEGCSSR